MFDTIRMVASGIYLDIDQLSSNLKEIVTYLNKTTGELNDTVVIKDSEIPYMKYFQGSHTLLLQISIPKFLYGNNLTLINSTDIELFWSKLQEKLKYIFNKDFDDVIWKVTRIDVSWNFQVGSLVGEYIRQLGKKRFPFKDTVTYNHNETVIFQNNSSRIMFYDKEKESLKKNVSDDVLGKSKGIIRMEISPSSNDIKKLSPNRLARELLSKEFFIFIASKVEEQLSFPSCNNEYDYEWLKTQKITQVETVIGFLTLLRSLEESLLKQLYTPATYINRRNLVRELQFPKNNALSKLSIDYSNIG